MKTKMSCPVTISGSGIRPCSVLFSTSSAWSRRGSKVGRVHAPNGKAMQSEPRIWSPSQKHLSLDTSCSVQLNKGLTHTAATSDITTDPSNRLYRAWQAETQQTVLLQRRCFNLYFTKGTMDEVQIVGNSKYNIPSSESHRTSCLLYNIIVSSKLAQPIPLQTSIIFFWNETWHCLSLLETIPRVVQITAVQLAAFHSRCTTQLTQQSSALMLTHSKHHDARSRHCLNERSRRSTIMSIYDQALQVASSSKI